jgi:hypothetical protein
MTKSSAASAIEFLEGARRENGKSDADWDSAIQSEPRDDLGPRNCERLMILTEKRITELTSRNTLGPPSPTDQW